MKPDKTKKSITEKIRETGKHTFIYGVGAVLQGVIGFALIPLYTKSFSAELYGVLTLINLCGVIASTVFSLGAASALSRSYFEYEDDDSRRKVVATALLISVVGALFQISIGILVGSHVSRALFNTEVYALHVTLVCASSSLGFINGLFYALLRLERRSSLVLALNACALTTNIVLVLHFLQIWKIGILAPILADAVISTLLFFVLVVVNRRHFGASASRKELKLQLAWGVPCTVIAIGQISSEWLDRFVIQNFDTAEDVGIYSFACRISMVIVSFFIGPFGFIWSPIRMEYYKDEIAPQLFSRILTYYFIVGTVLLVVLSLWAGEVAAIFARNPSYLKAVGVIPLVMFSSLIFGAINIVDIGVAVSRNIKISVCIFSITAAFSFLANCIFVPVYGYSASPVIKLVCSLVVVVATLTASQQYFRVQYQFLRIVAILGVAALAVAFGSLFNGSSYHQGLIFGVKLVCLAGFIATVIRFGLVQQERENLFKSLHSQCIYSWVWGKSLASQVSKAIMGLL